VDLILSLLFALLLPTRLEILAPFWAIFCALAHLISALIFVLDLEDIDFSFCFDVTTVVSSTILLLIEGLHCPSLQYPLVFSTSLAKSPSPHHH
jgi:hypothetical protein